MTIYAIAAFVRNNEPIGARLFNKDKNKFMDLANRDIINLISSKYTFANLDVTKNGVKWSCGVFDRYPQIFEDGTVKNENSTVVLGVSDNYDYKILDYKGRVAVIPYNKAVEIGKKFGFANCKISNKDGNFVIQQIYGNLPELKSELKMRITDLEGIHIDLPEDGSITELNIPRLIGGFKINNISVISVNSLYAASKITKITFDSNYMWFNSAVFGPFINLETVIMNGEDVCFAENTFNNHARLKQVYAKHINTIQSDVFRNAKELELVYSKRPINYISHGTFLGCPKIDIQKLLDQGVESIGADVFNNNELTEITIPETTKEINLNAFVHCKNLNRINIYGLFTEVNDSRESIKFKGDLYIVEGSKALDGDRYYRCKSEDNYGYPQTLTLHVIKSTDILSSKQVNTILKSKIVGMQTVKESLNLESCKSIRVALTNAKPEIVRAFIINAVNASINGSWWTNNITYKVNDWVIHYSIYHIKGIEKAKTYGEVEDGVYYSNNKETIVFITNKTFVLDYLDNYVKNSYNDKLYIPVIRINHSGKVDHIKYDSELKIVAVTFRNKDIEEIKLDDISVRRY